ncbi:MAG: InlB B-repeat-containing protein [Treponema sp.]|jgi:uncharacterized repeat protein (TIGR02543 family)|nr:InlB B-repeat-containing protein [Treponema sp.]
MMNTVKNTIRLPVCVLAVIVLGGCFSHWQGDTARIVISFGGAQRAADYRTDDTETHKKLKNYITLKSESETLDLEFTGTTFEADLAPGNWNVRIDSWQDSEIYATGIKNVVLKIGQNNETIEMHKAYLVTFDINKGSGTVQEPKVVKAGDPIMLPGGDGLSKAGYVFGGWNTNDKGTGENYTAGREYTPTDSIILYAKWEFISEVPGSDLAAKLTWLSTNADDGGSYSVTVDKEEDLAPRNLSYGKRITIILKGDTQERIVNLSGNGSLFTIDSGVTLILDNNITLRGHGQNDTSLVIINSGGTLEMNKGAKITGNTANSGGAVKVQGTFNMNSGIISGNTARETEGGGVWVSSGTFTMKDGEISGNTALDFGAGGVDVREHGTFIMEGGKITNNTAAKNSGGVEVDGTFIMKSGGEISDNNSSGGPGGVAVGGNFTMEGGKISNNTADNGSGGVFLGGNGSFTMEKGEISGNTATGYYGGGVAVVYGTFTMIDGVIYNNKAQRGGGVFVNDGANRGSTFNMNGGEIYNNTATENGGGVFIEAGKFIKAATGGTINDNIIGPNGSGKAVYARAMDGGSKKRDSNVDSNEALSFDGATGAFDGVWDD